MYNISLRNTRLNKSPSDFLVYIYMYIYILKKNRSIMIKKTKTLTHLDRIEYSALFGGTVSNYEVHDI